MVDNADNWLYSTNLFGDFIHFLTDLFAYRYTNIIDKGNIKGLSNKLRHRGYND